MSDDSTNKLGVGIIGCARIAKKNCVAASNPFASCRVTAISSRSQDKARDFVDEVFSGIEHRPTQIFSGADAYDKLLESSESCDAVYIPLPTKLHENYVGSALRNKKHVLLEKPVAVSAQSYRDMLSIASKEGKFLMDGTMFVHTPRTKQLVNAVPNPNRVHFNFTFDGDEEFFKNDIRVKKEGDFMGCVGDLGWYCVRMGLLVFSGLNAKTLRRGLVKEVQVVNCELNDEGVPIDVDCIVFFSEKRVLSIHCSFKHPLNQTVHIFGTGSEYTATVTDTVLPHKGEYLEISLSKQHMIEYDQICCHDGKSLETSNTNVQEVCMWHNFAHWAQKIDEESSQAVADVDNEKWWGGDSNEVKAANDIASYSLHTQIVLDGLMESIHKGGARIPL
ncbi:hypothetical protein ACHAXM_000213 [Skeletonema potamos]|jgi:predicted dehydrogenase